MRECERASKQGGIRASIGQNDGRAGRDKMSAKLLPVAFNEERGGDDSEQ